MRGGVTIEEAYNLSHEDKMLINDIVKENMETTKKSGLPFFQIKLIPINLLVPSNKCTRIPKSLQLRLCSRNILVIAK